MAGQGPLRGAIFHLTASGQMSRQTVRLALAVNDNRDVIDPPLPPRLGRCSVAGSADIGDFAPSGTPVHHATIWAARQTALWTAFLAGTAANPLQAGHVPFWRLCHHAALANAALVSGLFATGVEVSDRLLMGPFAGRSSSRL
jgi:hypothetical protein